MALRAIVAAVALAAFVGTAPPALAAPSGAAGVWLRGDHASVVEGDLVTAKASLADAAEGGAGWHWHGRGESRWSFVGGHLNLGAAVSVFGADLPVHPAGFFARAFAQMLDRVHVYSTALPVLTPLTLNLQLSVHGVPDYSWDGGTVAPANWLAPTGGARVSVSAPGIVGGADHSGTYQHAFVFDTAIQVLNGQPFDLSIMLSLDLAAAHDETAVGYVELYGGHSTSGRLDFLHTLSVAGLQVTDDSGVPVADALLLSSTGQPWLATPVPEPASAVLWLAGLAGAGVWRRRLLARRQAANTELTRRPK